MIPNNPPSLSSAGVFRRCGSAGGRSPTVTSDVGLRAPVHLRNIRCLSLTTTKPEVRQNIYHKLVRWRGYFTPDSLVTSSYQQQLEISSPHLHAALRTFREAVISANRLCWRSPLITPTDITRLQHGYDDIEIPKPQRPISPQCGARY